MPTSGTLANTGGKLKSSTQDRKARIAEVFGRAAPTYDRSGRFAYFGRRLVAAADLAPGATVLDVAAGRGAVLFAAAERVGPQGRVVAIDLSPAMVEATDAEIQRRGLTQAEIHCMDAERLAFPSASFDAVLCGFGIRFFSHLDRFLSEVHRVLQPQGVVAVSDWGQRDPRWERVQEVRGAYRVAEGLAVNQFRQPAEVESVLRGAGFELVDVRTDEAEFMFASEDEWWEDLWSAGLRDGLERLNPDTLAGFRAEVLRCVRELKGPKGIPERRQAIFGRGTNPDSRSGR